MSRIGGPISTRKRSRWLAGTRRTSSGPRPTRELRRTLARTRRSRRGRRSPARRRGHAPRGGWKFPARGGGRSSGPPACRATSRSRRSASSRSTRNTYPATVSVAISSASTTIMARRRRALGESANSAGAGRRRLFMAREAVSEDRTGRRSPPVVLSTVCGSVRRPLRRVLAGVHDPTPSRRLSGALRSCRTLPVREPVEARLVCVLATRTRTVASTRCRCGSPCGATARAATGSDSRKAANLRRARPPSSSTTHGLVVRSAVSASGVGGARRGQVGLGRWSSTCTDGTFVPRRRRWCPLHSFSALTTLP